MRTVIYVYFRGQVLKKERYGMKVKVFQILRFLYFSGCFFVVFTIHAHAYIDPSTVTYVIQGIAGVFIAVGAALTIFRHKIKAAWSKWYYGQVAKRTQKKAEKLAQADRKSE